MSQGSPREGESMPRRGCAAGESLMASRVAAWWRRASGRRGDGWRRGVGEGIRNPRRCGDERRRGDRDRRVDDRHADPRRVDRDDDCRAPALRSRAAAVVVAGGSRRVAGVRRAVGVCGGCGVMRGRRARRRMARHRRRLPPPSLHRMLRARMQQLRRADVQREPQGYHQGGEAANHATGVSISLRTLSGTADSAGITPRTQTSR